MRRQIGLLVAATSSAIILAFVIPLCLLVRSLAEDRTVADAQREVQAVTTLVTVTNEDRLATALTQYAADGIHDTTVFLPSGRVLGDNASVAQRDTLIDRAVSDQAAFTVRDASGVHIVVPVALPDGTAVVSSSVSPEALHTGVGKAWLGIGAVGFILFALSVIIARWLAGQISTPVTALAEVAYRLREGDMTARGRPGGPGEVAELSAALNQFADRIEELLQGEREFAADLSHRLRTPITALRLDTDLVADPETADRLRGHVTQLQRTVNAVIEEARRPSRDPLGASCQVHPVVEARVSHWAPLAEDQGRAVSVDLRSVPDRVALAAQDVATLVDTLIDNVFHHTPEGVAFGVSLHTVDGSVRLVVHDEGPGMPGGHVERGRSGGGSTGLGLDIARRLALGGGGELTVTTPAVGGTTVTVRLPVKNSRT